MHSLIHLADVVQKYGTLDNVSSGKLKRMVRTSALPLQQAVRRLSEQNSRDPHPEVQCDALQNQHTGGPLPRDVQFAVQYEEYKFPGQNYIISRKDGNNCLMVNGSIGLARNFIHVDGEHFVHGLSEIPFLEAFLLVSC